MSYIIAPAAYTQDMLRRSAILVAAAVFLIGCGPHSNLENRVFAGRTEAQVKAELGEPDKIDEMTKSSESIGGPIEDLWDDIDMGQSITIWTYNVDYGRKEIYWIPGRPDAAGEFFWYNDPSKNPTF